MDVDTDPSRIDGGPTLAPETDAEAPSGVEAALPLLPGPRGEFAAVPGRGVSLWRTVFVRTNRPPGPTTTTVMA